MGDRYGACVESCRVDTPHDTATRRANKRSEAPTGPASQPAASPHRWHALIRRGSLPLATLRRAEPPVVPLDERCRTAAACSAAAHIVTFMRRCSQRDSTMQGVTSMSLAAGVMQHRLIAMPTSGQAIAHMSALRYVDLHRGAPPSAASAHRVAQAAAPLYAPSVTTVYG